MIRIRLTKVTENLIHVQISTKLGKDWVVNGTISMAPAEWKVLESIITKEPTTIIEGHS